MRPDSGLQRFTHKRPAQKCAGLTLVELVAVLGIVIILATLLVGVISRLPGAGDRVRCTSNLKALYVGLTAYTEDKGHWPQQPDFDTSQQNKYEDWWIKELKPYQIPESAWQCPGIRRLGTLQEGKQRNPRVHYSPTMFDAQPRTPWKWPKMPWIIEIGSVHGRGPLMIFPDGSVRDYDDVMREHGAK